ncbi:hypothetical protein BDV98DRAFT_586461 [Pterulicium gracile]|uniref:Uncharacterized protein n=1 Tax=Pterulicium gracile TaxID=1884261 RepID=A0A5C3Q2E8_9AGAR|nr:hypothetical protein BDV98DRAFT_586461 [Pterula gracilis]
MAGGNGATIRLLKPCFSRVADCISKLVKAPSATRKHPRVHSQVQNISECTVTLPCTTSADPPSDTSSSHCFYEHSELGNTLDILTFVDIARSTKKRNDASDSDQSDIEDLHTFLNNLLDSELPSLMLILDEPAVNTTFSVGSDTQITNCNRMNKGNMFDIGDKTIFEGVGSESRPNCNNLVEVMSMGAAHSPKRCWWKFCH